MDKSTHPIGATPGEDVSGLKLQRLETREARNAAELEAITYAYEKYVYKPGKSLMVERRWLTEALIREVHVEMFGKIWDWAGKYRRNEVNIGVAWHLIPEQMALLCGDFEHWNSQESSMSLLEVAARLQNRITRIHPFANGNGRLARLITDMFFVSQKHPLPKWPQIQLESQGDKIRMQYITAMKLADFEDYSALKQLLESWSRTETQ